MADPTDRHMVPRRGRTGCLTCRRRHLKCDEEKPVCARCRKTARDCVADDQLTFRSGQRVAARGQLKGATAEGGRSIFGTAEHENIFTEDHCWLETPSKLFFVDETPTVTAEYQDCQMENDNADDQKSPSDKGLSPTSLATTQALLLLSESHACTPTLASAVPESVPSTPTYSPPSAHFNLPSAPQSHPCSSISSNAAFHRDDEPLASLLLSPAATTADFLPILSPSGGSAALHVSESTAMSLSPDFRSSPKLLEPQPPLGLHLYSERMLLPFTVTQEALLFHHYMEHLAALLDITDISRHFAVDVPERALSCPVLLNALMAFAGRHLSGTTAFDNAVADHYHHECVSLMIPMLSRKELVADETLFAAAVILRAFEETNEARMGAGPERHLTGTSVFANAQLEFRTWGGLGQAAFWVFVRQDIYLSLLSQLPLKVDLAGWARNLPFDLGFADAADCTWANRIIWIVAEIVSFCFSNNRSSGSSNDGKKGTLCWESARAKVERWDARRPKSFDPILYVERDPSACRWFPEIRLGHPWHVTGIQYYYIAKLFLAVYNPNIPKIGLGYQRLRRTVSEEVLQNAEAVCGIAFTTSLAAARLTACTAIVACGPWFHERPRAEQELLLQLLKRASAESAYPTASLAQGLMEEWGW